MDNEEGIRTLNALSCDLRVLSYLLSEAAHLIGLGSGPGGGVLWVFTELVILHYMARLFIGYCQSHGTGVGCLCTGMVSNEQMRRLWGWRRRGEDGA